MLREYRALVDKVTVFTDAVTARRGADLSCRAGCASCCYAWLTVSAVEAAPLREALAQLPADERARVRARGVEELLREGRGDAPARCAMLGDDERCVVYQGRPLVCRTQGHALRYPPGFIPEAAIARKSANGEETWCPLNYDAAEPNGEDVLDAERVDQILAVVSARYLARTPEGVQRPLARTPERVHGHDLAQESECRPGEDFGSHASGRASTQRFGISEIAAEEDVPNDQTARGAPLEATDG